MSDYVVRFTRLGQAFALGKGGGLLAVEARVRAEIEAEDVDVSGRFIMAVPLVAGGGFGEKSPPEILICKPDGSGGVLVDSAHWEEGEPLDRGPFAGKRVMMPVPDTEGD